MWYPVRPMRLTEAVVLLSDRTGPWLPVALGLASLVEFVLPPFPGDTVVLAGSVLAAAGRAPAWWVLLMCLAGSVAGAAIDYAIGARLRRRLARGDGLGWWERWLPPDRRSALEAAYRRHGDWLVLTNRLVPVSRAFVFVFAGMAGLPAGRTMVLGAISAAVWNGLLMAVAWWAGGRLDRIEALLSRLGDWSGSTVAALMVAGGLVWAWRAWRRRRAAVPPVGDVKP